MTPVQRLQAAIEWIESRDKLRVYRAPETLGDGEKWSIGVWRATLSVLRITLDSYLIERNWETLLTTQAALELADAILGGDS